MKTGGARRYRIRVMGPCWWSDCDCRYKDSYLTTEDDLPPYHKKCFCLADREEPRTLCDACCDLGVAWRALFRDILNLFPWNKTKAQDIGFGRRKP